MSRTNDAARIVGSTRTPRGDANYTILNTDRVVATSAAFTAARTFTLSAANTMQPGVRVYFLDTLGTLTTTNTLTVARAGSDTINGAATSIVLNRAFDFLVLETDGTSKWTVVGTSNPNVGARYASFRAHKNGTTQTGVANLTDTQITYSTVPLNVGGYFASNAWTPPAGKVLISLNCVTNTGIDLNGFFTPQIFKNGSSIIRCVQQAYSQNCYCTGHLVLIDDANGTDVYKAYIAMSSAGNNGQIEGLAVSNIFQGCMI